MYTTIRIAGRGGQGVKFAGTVLGEAALASGHHSTQTSRYTPSTRGGPIHCDIIISDEKIACPFVETPDILVILTEKAWYRHSKGLEKDAVIIINSSIVPHNIITHDPDKIISIPLEKISKEHNTQANVILIGYLARLLDLETFDEIGESMRDDLYNKYIVSSHAALFIKPKYLENAIKKVSPERFAASNMKAFNLGYEIAKEEHVSFSKSNKGKKELEILENK